MKISNIGKNAKYFYNVKLSNVQNKLNDVVEPKNFFILNLFKIVFYFIVQNNWNKRI